MLKPNEMPARAEGTLAAVRARVAKLTTSIFFILTMFDGPSPGMFSEGNSTEISDNKTLTNGRSPDE